MAKSTLAMEFTVAAAALEADIQRVLATLKDLRNELDDLYDHCSAVIASAELAQHEADERATRVYLAREQFVLEKGPESQALAAAMEHEAEPSAASTSSWWHYDDAGDSDRTLTQSLQDEEYAGYVARVARQEMSEFEALQSMEDLDRFGNCIRCPYCQWPLEILELNCTIFICGAEVNSQGLHQVNQHLNPAEIRELKRQRDAGVINLVGCLGQFKIEGAKMVDGKLEGGLVTRCNGL